MMPRLYCLLSLPVLCLLPLAAAHADQAAYISQEVADKATALLPNGTEYRNFCEPCGDTEPVADIVDTAKTQYTGSESFYEVVVNGTPVDLAYLYVQVDGVWTNVARHLGLEVEDVSTTIEDVWSTGEEEGGGYGRMFYAGTVGDKPVLMELHRLGNEFEGSYRYQHVGEFLLLNGAVDAEGKIALTETYDEEETGSFEGTLERDMSALKGKWTSADASRTVDFAFERFAVTAMEQGTASAPGVFTNLHLDYPFFTSHKAADALNELIMGAAHQRYREHVAGILTMAGELDENTANEDNPMMNLDMSLGDFMFSLYSEKFISLAFSYYDFGGGAHGNSATITRNLRVSGAGKVKELTAKELFADAEGALEVISAALIADLKKQDAAWIVDGQTTAFGWDDLGAWTVDAKGITFYFDPYAVGPYAQGPFESVVALKAVGQYLDREVLPASVLPKE